MINFSLKTVGSGPYLVMLHGWGMNSSIWDLLLPELQKQYTVICVDLPGHGQNNYNNSWSMDDCIDGLVQELPAESIVLGWSLGGMLALKLAHKYPSRVTKLILLASSAKFVRAKDWRNGQPKAVLQMFANSLLENPEATIRRFLLLQTQGAEKQKEISRLFKRLMKNECLPKLQGLKSGLAILQDADLREEFTALRCPILQILGQNDQLVPVAVAVDSKNIQPSLQVVTIAGAAHVPFISNQDETLHAISTFC